MPIFSTVSLTLFNHNGEPVKGRATIVLIPRTGRKLTLKRKSKSNIWQGRVKTGIYAVEVTSAKLTAPKQKLSVTAEDYSGSIYLGEKNWPYYRMGKTIIPFEPPQSIAIVNRKGVKATSILKRKIDKATKTLKLKPQKITAEKAIKVNKDIQFFKPINKVDISKSLAPSLFKELKKDSRVGIPVDSRPGSMKILDNEFIVRFKDRFTPSQVKKLIRTVKADIVRKMAHAPNSWLIRFRTATPLENIDVIESWHKKNWLVYGEPNLISEVVDDVFPYTDPDDPTFSSQDNLTLQKVPQAWKKLAEINPLIATGRPSVYVASLDRGIDMDHPDLGNLLSDGTQQFSRTFDFSGMRECTVAGYTPDTDHGMGVYGIIGASINNNEDIAGIAPNTHHIGLERPSLDIADYADVLLWTAGFVTDNPDDDWPEEPLSPAADIISCSHGLNNEALSGTMDDTYKKLAKEGRNGLGTIVVYSAGNDNKLITGYRTWAAHPDTIAVSNSLQPNASGTEVKAGTSNYGPEIDICAQGAGAPSLNSTGGEQDFGGTSAAAPTVAALCSLMLSVDPTLTLEQVRLILRETAVKIDPNCTDADGKWVNGFSQWYGYGRIDAAAAVERAIYHRGKNTTKFNNNNKSDILISSPWGIGILEKSGNSFNSIAMGRNGTRFNGWLLNTDDNRIDIMADLDGDGMSEMLITSPWGIGVFEKSGNSFRCKMLKPNGTRFGGWLLNTDDNRFGPVGKFSGETRNKFLVTSPWGIGMMRFTGTNLTNQIIKPNGTRFGGWLLNTEDNRLGPVGDFDGDGIDEVLITSPWGIGTLKAHGSTFRNPVIKRNGSRFNGWLLNTHDNKFKLVGDFDGDGKDEILVTSPWGIGILKQQRSTFSAIAMKPNGSRFNGWLLNTRDNEFLGAADFDGDGIDEIFVSSPWGIGILKRSGASFTCLALKPNGTRFDGWLLNTKDNHFRGFSDFTGDGKDDIVVTSPWGMGILTYNNGTFNAPVIKRNGTRFGGWLLNTLDNKFF